MDGSTTCTSPTNPSDSSRAVAVIMLASSPDRPTAERAVAFMADTISRLTLPTSTMRAISRVSASVTRMPSRNSGTLPSSVHELTDLRAAAVDDDGQHPDRAHEDDVLGERRQGVGRVGRIQGGNQRVAPVLDDDDLPPEAQDIGECFDQDGGPVAWRGDRAHDVVRFSSM